MSLIEQYNARSRQFHAHIARKAAELQMRLPVVRSYAVPCKQFSPAVSLPPEFCYSQMWFYDLVFRAEPKVRVLNVALVQEVVCKHYGIKICDLISARRTADIVKPRQVAFYLAKTITPRSLPDIGRRFGGKDHTTVLHAVRKMERLIKTNPDIAAEIKSIESKIRSAT